MRVILLTSHLPESTVIVFIGAGTGTVGADPRNFVAVGVGPPNFFTAAGTVAEKLLLFIFSFRFFLDLNAKG